MTATDFETVASDRGVMLLVVGDHPHGLVAYLIFPSIYIGLDHVPLRARVRDLGVFWFGLRAGRRGGIVGTRWHACIFFVFLGSIGVIIWRAETQPLVDTVSLITLTGLGDRDLGHLGPQVPAEHLPGPRSF